MDLQDLVRGYYGSGGLTEAVLGALSSAGIDVDHFTPADLFLVDHLHAGGRRDGARPKPAPRRTRPAVTRRRQGIGGPHGWRRRVAPL